MSLTTGLMIRSWTNFPPANHVPVIQLKQPLVNHRRKK